MRARSHAMRGLAAAALVLTLAGCGGGGGNSNGPSGGSGGAGGGGAQQVPIAKVTPPATPPSLPAGFPVADWKNAKSEIVFDKSGIAKVTYGGKTGTTLYTVSDNSINFNNDDAGVCDSPATYAYALTGGKLTLTLTTVDLCSERSAGFSAGPFTKS